MLNDHDVLRLWTFVAANNCELYFLSIFQRAVTFAADRAEMNENVFTLLSLNEAITLTVIKPLDGTGFSICHLYSPPCC